MVGAGRARAAALKTNVADKNVENMCLRYGITEALMNRRKGETMGRSTRIISIKLSGCSSSMSISSPLLKNFLFSPCF